MRRFLSKILLFAAILAISDLVVGDAIERMRKSAKGNNETSRSNYIAKTTEAPVVIFGSSRAYHHYVSPIISDSTNLETVNAGEDGNGIILAYGRYLLMSERHSPKVALLDIEPGFDIAETDNSRYLKPLRPYFDDSSALRELFADIEPAEPIKMYSRTYRYNSMLPGIAKALMAKDSLTDYEILREPADNFESKLAMDRPFHGPYDPVKRRYLIKFIEESRRHGTMPIIAFSPHYGKTDSKELDPVRKVAEEYGVPVLDHFADTMFMNRRDYFVDPYHLNERGAEIYSAVIARELRPFLKPHTAGENRF